MSNYDIYLQISKLISGLDQDKNLIERLIIQLMGELDLLDRISFAENLYTADFTEKKRGDDESDPIIDRGSMAMRFWELNVGEVFICVPGPEDKYGNGGLRHALNVYRKDKHPKLRDRLDMDEFSNSTRVTDQREFTIHPNSWVFKINL